jgi:hypothetical protein
MVLLILSDRDVDEIEELDAYDSYLGFMCL